MLESILKSLLDHLVELLAVWIVSIGGLVLHKAREYFKAQLTDAQYELMCKISKDIYEYVEREYGEKLKKAGHEKLQIAIEEFNEQMKKHGLPYDANDFVLQVEKIIKQEKDKFGV